MNNRTPPDYKTLWDDTRRQYEHLLKTSAESDKLAEEITASLSAENAALRAELDAEQTRCDGHERDAGYWHYRALRTEAELDALKAATEWRPGSETPPAPDWYQVADIGIGVYDLWYSGSEWHKSSFQGVTYRTPSLAAPDFWRPIPPLPPAPDDEVQP